MRTMHVNRQFALFAMLLVWVGSAWAVPVTYIVTDIGTLPGGGNSRATGINNLGDAVGKATDVQDGYNDAAVLFENGTLINLGSLGVPYGIFSEAMALNDAGQIVGDTNNGVAHAFIVDGGQIRSLETLPNTFGSQPFAISAGGQVVGTVAILISPNSVQWHAFSSDGHTMVDLTQALGGIDYSEALGINDSGQIVGVRRVGQLATHAYMLDGSTATDLGTLAEGSNSEALAINSSGQVVGLAYTSDGTAHPFLYKDGTMNDLGLLPDAQSGYATSINSSGVVVGTMRFPGYSHNTRAFIYTDGGLRDLNDLVSAGSGWVLRDAVSINAEGEIAGSGLHNGANRGFVLQPIVLGDANCDGAVNNFDITPFVLALSSPSQYAAQFPGCNILGNDINGDGLVNNFDITPFVQLLTGP